MGKNFVTYDQSLALKELGFNEPCFGVFYLNVERKIWEQSRTIQESKHNESDFAISRPLVGQVFEWFIEKYKLNKIIDNWTEQPMGDEIWVEAYQYYINGEAYHPYFKTYEEAESACIDKLIEIVKGEKHSSSKVKTLAAVDVEKLNTIKEFVDYSVSESRFNQALENIFPNNEPIDVKKMGDVIRWVVNDVIKEEMDTMVENQLEPKEINKYISSKVREMFFKMA
jgi:hypothetical protein